MPTVTANGKKFTFPDGVTPEQMGEAIDEYFSSLSQESAEPQDTRSALDKAIAPAAEFASAANRAIFGTLDLIPGAINAGLDAVGSDMRVPGFEQKLGSPGGYMQPGLARDVVSSAGSVVPAALGAGALFRGAAQQLPAMASGAESVGAGVLRQLGSTTAKSDAALGAVSGAGAALGGAAGEEIGGETGRQAGEMIGGFAAPMIPAAKAAVSETARRAFRGGEKGREILQKAIDDFAEFGATPTVGAGTGDKLRQGLENLSSRFFGGGALLRASEIAADKMQARLSSIADDLSLTRGGDEAGRVIEKGIKGEGGFIDRFKSTSRKLWGSLDAKIPATTQVKPEKTMETLSAMVRDDSIGKILNNSKIEGVYKALNEALGPVMTNNSTLTRSVSDVAYPTEVASNFTGVVKKLGPDFSKTLGTRKVEFKGGSSQQVPVRNLATGAPVVRDTIEYGDLKALRSQIGEMLGSNDLISDIPRSQLKRLYASLSDDVRAAAESAGAANEFSRANNYTRAGHDRIEGFVEKIVNKGELDKIFEAAAKGGEGLQRINAIKRSLKPEEWEVVSSNVVRRLGQATSGQQGAVGESFSVAKFLTDWNKLGRAKNVIFSGSEKLGNYRENLDKIARASERMKFAAREMQNPSGTAQAVANYGTISAGGASLATGNLGAFGTILMTVAANNGAARLMSNPSFVRWLARSTTVKDLPAHIAAIGSIQGDDEDLASFANDLNSVIAEKDRQPSRTAERQ